MSGFLTDMVGTAGCDGGGNAMVSGMNKMFSEGRMVDPVTDMAMGEGVVDDIAFAGGESGWQEDFFAEQQQQQHLAHAAVQESMAAEFFAQQQQHHDTAQQEDWAQQFQNSEPVVDDWAAQFHKEAPTTWAEEFTNDECLTFGVEGETEVPFEVKQGNCQFFKYLDKVRQGEIVLDEPDQKTWGDEFTGTEEHDAMVEQPKNIYSDAAIENDWVSQFNNISGGDPDFATQYASGGGMAPQQPVSSEKTAPAAAKDWATEYSDMLKQEATFQTEYVFQENNHYLMHANPFQEGLDLLSAGTLSEAVLAFEAVCQQKPEDSKAWELLGTTQAENEKDIPAIIALRQCRALDQSNLPVLMSLSVSLTNESKYSEAIDTLQSWLLTNPEYAAMADRLEGIEPSEQQDDPAIFGYAMTKPIQHSKCTAMFQAAVEEKPSPELYTALGILHNMTHDYMKAVDAFQRVIETKPDDYKLWNKLGASLANGNRCSEAINAYNRALDLNPGYVRGHYNLGISYSNLGEHAKAAEYFLRAISMQSGGKAGASGTQEMWDVLRMTFSLMGRHDLVSRSLPADVAAFKDEFNIGWSMSHYVSQCCHNCATELYWSNWPTTSTVNPNSEQVCLGCGGRGHSVGACPSPKLCKECRLREWANKGVESLPCSVCGGRMHRAQQCPSRMCRRCGASGHYDSDCLIGGPMPATFVINLQYPGEQLGMIIARPGANQPMRVCNVTKDGPADIAGLELGTLIHNIDGHAVSDRESLMLIMKDVHHRKVTRIVVEAEPMHETTRLNMYRHNKPLQESGRKSWVNDGDQQVPKKESTKKFRPPPPKMPTVPGNILPSYGDGEISRRGNRFA